MADIFGGVEPPAWLQRMTAQTPGELGSIFGELVGGLADSAEIAINSASTKQAKGINTSWIKELPASIKPGLAEARLNSQNPLWKMQAQQAQLNMAEQGLRMQNEQSLIDSRKTKLRMQEHDQDVLPKWLQDHPTWESRQEADPPVLYTTEAQRMFRDVQLGDAGNAKHKAITSAIDAYSKQVAALEKLDPIAAAPFAAQIGAKLPSPEMQQKLSEALGAAQAKSTAAQQAALPVHDESGNLIGHIVKGKFVEKKKEPADLTKAVPVYDENGKVIGHTIGTKFQAIKEPKPAAAPKLSEAKKSELLYARQHLEGIEKAMNDPVNKNNMETLRNQWFEARKYYNRLLKESETTAPAAAAPAAAPAGPPTMPFTPSGSATNAPPTKVRSYDPATDSLK